MARITPKTNWVAGDIPVLTDFNRIENNSEQAFTELDATNAELDAEVAARIAADNVLQNNITAEANARILGDTPYTGSNSNNLDFPIGTNVFVSSDTNYARNAIVPVKLFGSTAYVNTTGTLLNGTWRSRGSLLIGGSQYWIVAQRTE